MIEQGVLSTPCPVEFWLIFKGFPIWLIALDSKLVSQVWVLGSSSHKDFLKTMIYHQGADMNMLNMAIDNIRHSKVLSYPPVVALPKGTVRLVSGSLPM